jgi:hypothetical protein
MRVDCGDGYLVLNRRNGSIDVHCSVCGASKDLKYTGRPRARAPRMLAQGRPIGTQLAWLNFERVCLGDPSEHLARWTDEDLPHQDRVLQRNQAQGDPDFELLFQAERGPRDGEVDGEPPVIPG